MLKVEDKSKEEIAKISRKIGEVRVGVSGETLALKEAAIRVTE